MSGVIAAFTGLYFTIAMLTDSTFLDGLTEEMREVFNARTEFRLRPETAAG